MEINKFDEVTGVVAGESIVEGRMVVVLPTSPASHDFGSNTDLPLVRKPQTSTEAAQARYCLTFAVDNSQTPIYVPYPSFSFALRQGFDQAANVPFSADVYLTAPGMMLDQTVPSGALALAFGEGVYTVSSGQWITASVVRGCFLKVADTASDSALLAGQLKYSATASFAECVSINSDGSLTFKILY